jgi:hypothetical protein
VKPGEAPAKALVRQESDGGQRASEVGFPECCAHTADGLGLEAQARELELVGGDEHDERAAGLRPRARKIRVLDAKGGGGVAGLGGCAPRS